MKKIINMQLWWIISILGLIMLLSYHKSTEPTPDALVGDLNQPAQITISEIKSNFVAGTANNIDTAKARVVLWAKTDQWYIQLWIDKPYTTIDRNGKWSNYTHPWSRLVTLLVDKSYQPGDIRQEHPSNATSVLAWDEYPTKLPDRTITFSGYTWKVKEANLAGPGPNYFSADTSNVKVDDLGLHLKIINRFNRWYCAEVFLDHSLVYGRYQFQLISRVAPLDYQTVFAGFIYQNDENEVDIEFSRALAAPNNLQYVVQPWYRSNNIHRFQIPALTTSTHQFSWYADSITFLSWRGLTAQPTESDIIQNWTYKGNDIPQPGQERMRFNL